MMMSTIATRASTSSSVAQMALRFGMEMLIKTEDFLAGCYLTGQHPLRQGSHPELGLAKLAFRTTLWTIQFAVHDVLWD